MPKFAYMPSVGQLLELAGVRRALVVETSGLCADVACEFRDV